MTVYIDDAFTGDWGKWTGGGHLQADTLEELHAFAARLGLKRSWFQDRPTRPEMSHYDCTRSKRELALRLGAVGEDAHTSARRTLARIERRRVEAANKADAPTADPQPKAIPKDTSWLDTCDEPVSVHRAHAEGWD